MFFLFHRVHAIIEHNLDDSVDTYSNYNLIDVFFASKSKNAIIEHNLIVPFEKSPLLPFL